MFKLLLCLFQSLLQKPPLLPMLRSIGQLLIIFKDLLFFQFFFFPQLKFSLQGLTTLITTLTPAISIAISSVLRIWKKLRFKVFSETMPRALRNKERLEMPSLFAFVCGHNTHNSLFGGFLRYARRLSTGAASEGASSPCVLCNRARTKFVIFSNSSSLQSSYSCPEIHHNFIFQVQDRDLRPGPWSHGLSPKSNDPNVAQGTKALHHLLLRLLWPKASKVLCAALSS